MPRSHEWPGRAARGAVLAALVLGTAAGGSLGGSPDDAEPTPWSGEVRYSPVEGEFCDQLSWDRNLADLGVRIEEVRAELLGGWSWQVRCDVSQLDVAYPGDDSDPLGFRLGVAYLGIELFLDPDDAHTAHRISVGALRDQHERASQGRPTIHWLELVEDLEGWWDKLVSLEAFRVRPSEDVIDGSVTYLVYHENIILFSLLAGDRLDSERDIETFHDAARAMIDDAKAHLPCRSLVDPPISGCD